jgi:hypothetical protein
MAKPKTLIMDQVTKKLIETGITGAEVRVQISITHGVSLTPAAARALAKRLRQLADQLDPQPQEG